MKKVKYLLLVCMTMFAGILTVNAAGFTIARSADSVNIGNNVNITVTASGGDGWEYCVTYNQEVFKFLKNNSDQESGSACIKTGMISKGASVTFTFQAIKSGTGNFSVSGQIYDANVNPVPTDGASTKVEVKTAEEASKKTEENTNLSSNANLRLLEVVGYTLNPEFNKEKTEYTLDVAGDVETVQVNAFREDTTAQITPIDMVNLSEGVNKISVTVTAAKGNKKTYTITITRAEANPIKVEVDGKEYSVVNKEGAIEIPAGFVTTTVDIDGKEAVAYKNEQAKITLVVLKDAESNMSYYMFKNGEFTPYQQITGSPITIVPIKTDKPGVANYDKSKNITIGDKEVLVYYKEGNEDVVLIYGINTATGEEGWYYYDTKEKSLFKYITNAMPSDDIDADKMLKSKNDYKLLTMIFGGVSGLALLLILILIIFIIRLRKKNEELFKYMEKRIEKHRDKKFNNIGDKDIEKSDLASFDDTNSDLVIEEDEEETNSDEDTEEVEEYEDEVEDEYEEEIEDEVEDEYEEEYVDDDTFDDKTILIREDEIIDLDEDDYDDEPKKKVKEPTLMSDTDILRNIAKANEESFQDEEPKKLSKKEEKRLKKQQKALAKKAQREFLDDEEFEESAFDIYERDETEVIPVVKKKARTKGRKKS